MEAGYELVGFLQRNMEYECFKDIYALVTGYGIVQVTNSTCQFFFLNEILKLNVLLIKIQILSVSNPSSRTAP